MVYLRDNRFFWTFFGLFDSRTVLPFPPTRVELYGGGKPEIRVVDYS